MGLLKERAKQGFNTHVDVDGFLLSYNFNPANRSVIGVYRSYIISMKDVSPLVSQDEIIDHVRQLVRAMEDNNETTLFRRN